MSPRDLVYVGHMLDMAKKAISKTRVSRAVPTTRTRTSPRLTHLIQIIVKLGARCPENSRSSTRRSHGRTSLACATKWSTITSR